jgi:hypothetical protein
VKLEIGEFEIWTLETGSFRLDGGAMFGHVPKTLWEKKISPDADNRIPLELALPFAPNSSVCCFGRCGYGN